YSRWLLQRSMVCVSSSSTAPRELHSFPTRRSSDLGQVASNTLKPRCFASSSTALETPCAEKITVAPAGTSSSSSTNTAPRERRRDRKSTRLNSSHVKISYAVFCLKKKTTSDTTRTH